MPNSRTPIFDLNISELPLNKKETGNTLETKSVTYSYTLLTKPKHSTYGRFASAKNAHLGCKGTKLFPHHQISFVNSGLLIAFCLLIQQQSNSHSMQPLRHLGCDFYLYLLLILSSLPAVQLHVSYIPVTYRGHSRCPLFMGDFNVC